MKKTGAHRPRWMLVDDNQTMLDLMRELIAMISDAELVCFSSALDALEKIKSAPGKFQFVITDLEMPSMNGIEFRRALQQFAPDLPVMLATGSSSISDEEAAEHGFSCLLPKPSSPLLLKRFKQAFGAE